MDAVIEFANYRRTRADFERLQHVLAIATAVVLVGVVMFAIAAPRRKPDRMRSPGTPPPADTDRRELVRRY